ncbi:hypothetical protein QTQ03_26720 [Micromonospora sp. WMMA1363]|uniref:hypothetical protein n=1 Tax=Micromonospora sp. WMMA1363 TaxID=3053985 RepID=UPI00259CC2BD|nr:hypothetical protein [Micromonospora sp. WMMA1363]MDM4723018.1 hypothetical protein [Micromonospora sp. WMMA1363]
MENEDRPLAWFVNFCRDCFREFTRFVWAFYGGAAETGAAGRAQRSSQDTLEKAP